MKSPRLVLPPHEPLVDRAAELFERQLQAALADGRRDLVIDLSGVEAIDDQGVRGLVRGYTTARRLGGNVRLVAPPTEVLDVLRSVHLDSVFPIADSIESLQGLERDWQTIGLTALGVAFCLGLVWVGQTDSGEPGLTSTTPFGAGSSGDATVSGGQPLLALMELLVGTRICLLVIAVHRPTLRERPMNRSMEHAQTLLCVSGAMVMIIIGNSIARAFGIAGAATIIRFRTPVDDP